MPKPNLPAFVILSAARANRTDDINEKAHRALRVHLGDADFKEVAGCYKGVCERSFLVLLNEKFTEEDALHLAQWFVQESFLLVSACRHASLVFTVDESVAPLGQWRRIDRLTALQRDAYTQDGNAYYGVL